VTLAREFNSQAPPLGAVRAFDGVRGVGVWLVLLQHAWAVAESISGYIDLFFVVSGFLITTLIFEEKRSSGDVSLRNFYARRGIRLLPGLIVVLIIFWIPIALFARDLLTQVTLESLATLFYVHNIFFSPLLGSTQYMGQMWSLSLEEQFYLLGAVATYLCLKRGWIRQLAVALTGFILFVWVARAMGHGGPGQFWFQRPDAIALGVVLAIVHAEMPRELSPKWAKRLLVAGWISFVTFVFAILSSSKLVERLTGFYVPLYPTDVDIEIPDNATRSEFQELANEAIQQVLAQLPDGNYWARWGFTLATASAAVLTLAFVRLRDDFPVSRWLSGRLLGYFGALSYVLYISHYQLFKLMDPAGNGGPKWIPFKLGAAFLLGAALHKWVEKPAMRKLRHRFTHQVVRT
jgi:peptidoglycan/LPS O-acetylase OafA/YrhL